jgi:hypothetical protein
MELEIHREGAKGTTRKGAKGVFTAKVARDAKGS